MDKIAFYKEQILEKVAEEIKLTPEQRQELKNRQRDAMTELKHEIKVNAPTKKRLAMSFGAMAKGGIGGAALGAAAGALAHKKLNLPTANAAMAGAYGIGGAGYLGGMVVGNHKGTKMVAHAMADHAEKRYKNDSEEVRKAAKRGGIFPLMNAEKVKYLEELRNKNK